MADSAVARERVSGRLVATPPVAAAVDAWGCLSRAVWARFSTQGRRARAQLRGHGARRGRRTTAGDLHRRTRQPLRRGPQPPRQLGRRAALTSRRRGSKVSPLRHSSLQRVTRDRAQAIDEHELDLQPRCVRVLPGCRPLRSTLDQPRQHLALSAIRRRSITFVIALAGLLIGVDTATAYLQRTVNGPASVVPGHVYTFYVSGFSPGEAVYPTVQPVSCARISERCAQDPCPSCGVTRIGGSGTATVRLRWPRRSLYAFANMFFAHHKWQPGSRALVRINLDSTRVPRGCQRMPSITANPQAGSVVCAATLTQIR
jgi:hypothetical protein